MEEWAYSQIVSLTGILNLSRLENANRQQNENDYSHMTSPLHPLISNVSTSWHDSRIMTSADTSGQVQSLERFVIQILGPNHSWPDVLGPNGSI